MRAPWETAGLSLVRCTCCLSCLLEAPVALVRG